MDIREKQLRYGFLFGFGTFVMGWGITHFFTPASVLPDHSRWQVSLWMYLSAHSVSISNAALGQTGNVFVQTDLVEASSLEPIRAVPVLITAIGGLLMVQVVGYTRRLRYVLENSFSLLVGYLTTGILAIIISGASPGMTVILVLALVLATAVAVGSVLAKRLTVGIPVVALTSIGGLAAIGLVVFVGGLGLLAIFGPFVLVSTIGVLGGGLFAWTARNVPQ